MNFVLKLSSLDPGNIAYVVKINTNDKLHNRLSELGFIKGQKIN